LGVRSLARKISLTFLAAVILLTTGALPALAGPAGAPGSNGPVSKYHHFLPLHKRLNAAGRANNQATAVPVFAWGYGGGPVMKAGSQMIPIFWEPTQLQNGFSGFNLDPNYNALVEQFLGDLGGHGLYNIVTQYYENGPVYIVNSSGLLQAIVDTSAYPAAGPNCSGLGHINCVDDSQIQAEVAKVINAGSLPTGYSTMYPVFTDPLESSCADSSNCYFPNSSDQSWTFCAYHGSFTLAGHEVIYADMPYLDANADSVAACFPGGNSPNANSLDHETSALSHEIIEAVTDPDGNAWFDQLDGYEIGDICIGIGTQVNWGANSYIIQNEYSDAAQDCLPGGNNQLSLSVTGGAAGTPSTVTGTGFGASETVHLSFSDAAGTVTQLGTTSSNGAGAISKGVTIPAGAVDGVGTLEAAGLTPDDGASAGFTVSSGGGTTYNLTVSKTGSGTGGVTSAPAGINCGATCQASFNSGTHVTLTASPDAGSSFTGWSGSGCSGTSTCQVTMSQARSVSAAFTITTYNLTVSKNGSGTGGVTSQPAGIDCGATCGGNFNSGTQVTLTATPDVSSSFTGWSGSGCSGTGTCQVAMSQARAVTATFAANFFNLSVSKNGSGTGGVTSQPAGIDCGVTCQASVNNGDTVTLTATPDAGSSFTGWTGAGCSGTALCQVTMSQAWSVTATFSSNAVVYRPDSLLALGAAPFIGNNVYDLTGASEVNAAMVHRGTTGTFRWRVQNDGNQTDRIQFSAPGTSGKFTLKFLVGTANVTKAVVAGTYEKTLAPGAYLTITVKITVASNATVGSIRNEKLTAISTNQPVGDVVVAKVTVS
jgi:hypothetical protein